MRFKRIPTDNIKKVDNRYSIKKGIFENPGYKEYVTEIYQQRPSLQAFSSENIEQIVDKKYNSKIQIFNPPFQEQEFKNSIINRSFENFNNRRSSPRLERILNYAINKKDSNKINAKTLINERIKIPLPAKSINLDSYKRNSNLSMNYLNENNFLSNEKNPSSPQNIDNIRIETQNEFTPSPSIPKRFE